MGACLESPPLESAADENESVPESKEVPSPGGERVLLLEDDRDFKETLKDFMTESGYAVTRCQDGVEGIQEIMAGDFAIILCDMMMPNLSGEMFYRAVKQVRPHLCERFVFMTGHRGDQKTNDFIKSVNGRVLIKPFSMSDLMDSLGHVGSGSWPGGTVGAFETFPGTIVPFVASSTTAPQPKTESLPVQTPQAPKAEAAANVLKSVSPASTAIPVRRPAGGYSSVEKEPRESERSYVGLICIAVGICIMLGAAFHVWSSNVRTRIAASEGDIQALETAWADVSAQLQEVENIKPRIETLLNLPKRIAEDRQAPGWAPLLEAVAISAGAEIVLQEIRAGGIPGGPGACEMHLKGSLIGKSPRALADGFRKSLQAGLESRFRSPVMVRFDELEDETDPASGRLQYKVNFTITAFVGAKTP